MPYMNFDLEDGKPPVSFAMKEDDCLRFVVFMADCNADQKDAERYRWLRNKGWVDPSLYATGPREWGVHGIALLAGVQLDAAIDGATDPCAG